MTSRDATPAVSRRAVLKASGGAAGLLGVGSASASGGDTERCPDATLRPSMIHYDHSLETVCSDDHPATKELKADVADALEYHYPTVGALIDDGFIPYFDFFTAEEGEGWSHWINPEYLGDDSVMDPDRPESVLVDHRWWRPIGVMFIATRGGEPVEHPPAVYLDEKKDEECLPWHAHVGLPGRYGWWKYQQLYSEHAEKSKRLPCRTPWMMHVWAYPHPESVYAHPAPPRGKRGGPPAEPAGFETDAVPGEDELGWRVLPDALRHRIKHRK